MNVGFGANGVDYKGYSAADLLFSETEIISRYQKPLNSVSNELLGNLRCICVQPRRRHAPL